MVADKILGWVDRRVTDCPVGRDRRGVKTRRLGDAKMTRGFADWLYQHRWWPWVITATIMLTAVIPARYDVLRFHLFPVLDMRGDLVSKTPEYARLHIYGIKLRGVECRYLGIQAFADRMVGLPSDMTIARISAPETGATKPAGSFDLGVWEVKPVMGAVGVRVYVAHDCDGSRVATKVAEVAL